VRTGGAELLGLSYIQTLGDVTQRIMRRGLVGEGVRCDIVINKVLEENDCVTFDTDGDGFVPLFGIKRLFDGGGDVRRDFVEVTIFDATIEAMAIDFGDEADAFVHGYGERLGTSHSAAAGCYGEGAFECSIKMLPRAFGECFVSSLEDALRSDVDP